MRCQRLAFTGLFALTLLTFQPAWGVDDHMYPPVPTAKPAIDIDGRGFIINGQCTYVASGSIHYPRVPHELWRDRLLRLQRASFNCVQTYAFWNLPRTARKRVQFHGRRGTSAHF